MNPDRRRRENALGGRGRRSRRDPTPSPPPVSVPPPGPDLPPWVTTKSGKRKRRSATYPRAASSSPVYQVEPDIWANLPTDIKMSILASDPTLAARVMEPGVLGGGRVQAFGPNPISLRDVRGSLAIKRKGCVGDKITVQELVQGMDTYRPQSLLRLGIVVFSLSNSSGTLKYQVEGRTLSENARRRLAEQTGTNLADVPFVDWNAVVTTVPNGLYHQSHVEGPERIADVVKAYGGGDLYWTYSADRRNGDTVNNIRFLRHILFRRPGCGAGFLRGVPDNIMLDYLRHYGIEIPPMRLMGGFPGPYQKG